MSSPLRNTQSVGQALRISLVKPGAYLSASYLEQYEARDGGVTLHTWTDMQGAKKANLYITGMPGIPIPWWFRKVLRQKHLADIANFPYTPSCFYA